jgi:8-oxo-dGTP pyrophosphatase MutT (NUDIX family)
MKVTPKSAKKAKVLSAAHPRQTAMSLTEAKRQVAALPFRRTADGQVEVLLITSRETGRFIIPKGWPMKRLSDPDAAAREAYEEAGVIGKVKRKPIGDYIYWKRLERSFELLKVEVYAFEVQKQRANWPEKSARKYEWLSSKDAAIRVDEPGLVALLKTFEP